MSHIVLVDSEGSGIGQFRCCAAASFSFPRLEYDDLNVIENQFTLIICFQTRFNCTLCLLGTSKLGFDLSLIGRHVPHNQVGMCDLLCLCSPHFILFSSKNDHGHDLPNEKELMRS